MFERSLNPIEKSVIHFSLNTMIQFECKNIRIEDLKNSILMTRERFQYLRFKILRDKDGFKFVENDTLSVDFEVFYLKSLEDIGNWKDRHEKFGSKNHNLEKGVLFFELFTFENFYELHMSSNHAGNDARGHFSILKEIISNLESLLSNQILNKDRKNFLNIHTNFDHSFNLDDLKNEPAYENEFQRLDLKNEKNPNYFFEFFEFNEEITEILISNCKENNCTIQSILSLAGTIAYANEKIDLKSLDGSIECLNSIPCDMRYYFGLGLEDLIKGAASLCWLQRLAKGDDLWKVARQIKEKINTLKNSNEGIKWWLKCLNGIKLHKYQHIESSLGKFSFDEENLRYVKIKDLRFSCSAPYKEINKDCVGNVFYMIHVFAFQNRLKFNFCYNYAPIDRKWSKNFFKNVENILFSFTKKKLVLEDVIPLLDKHMF